MGRGMADFYRRIVEQDNGALQTPQPNLR